MGKKNNNNEYKNKSNNETTTTTTTTNNNNKNEKKTTTTKEAILNVLIDDEKKAIKRVKQETYLTSGCGYGRAKKRLLQAFWSTLWPKLENDCNWQKIEPTGEEAGAIYFIPPKPDITHLGRGKKYYD